VTGNPATELPRAGCAAVSVATRPADLPQGQHPCIAGCSEQHAVRAERHIIAPPGCAERHQLAAALDVPEASGTAGAVDKKARRIRRETEPHYVVAG